MKVKALNEWILIKADKSEETTDTGLMVPDVEADRTEAKAIKGTVEQVPDGVEQVEVGDTVWVAKWEIHKAWIGGVEHMIAKEEHLLMKVAK